MKFNKKSKGFTLIELLVVVAIIGVLATIVLSSLSDARARARDAKRVADIRAIQTALEFYHLDNGHYPVASGWASSAGSRLGNWSTLESELGITLPNDPINVASGNSAIPPFFGDFVYTYFADLSPNACNGQAYVLIYNLESGWNDQGVVNFCNNWWFYHGNAFVNGVDNNGRSY